MDNFSQDSIVGEIFEPKLNDKYNDQFSCLISKLTRAYSGNRVSVVNKEISDVLVDYDENDLEKSKYLSAICALKDLLSQGWVMEANSGKLFLSLPQNTMNDKESIRARLDAERRAQFNSKSIREFILYMERDRSFSGRKLSIKNLIGNKAVLIEKVEQYKMNEPTDVVQPYIQLADNKRDEFTGYRLLDIWKYFRYSWSIPYKTMPGRNIFYLVRDRGQEFHPVIGIFALGNTVLNLTVRDTYLGWTVEAVRKQLERKSRIEKYQESLSNTSGKTIAVENRIFLESEEEYERRVTKYCKLLFELIQKNITLAIRDVYSKDLVHGNCLHRPTISTIEQLRTKADELREKQLDTKKGSIDMNWEDEAKTILFTKKRALELSNLLEAKRCLLNLRGDDEASKIKELMSSEHGRKCMHTALLANRKNKIGSNMMEIIVCGAVPPYNELLGGKLISILACSPQVINDYKEKYSRQVSEIASRMKGEKVVRDSRLAFLSTTSLYHVGSSQYNRIRLPIDDNFKLEFKELGITSGYGSVYFSKETTQFFANMQKAADGGKKINNVFGEGTSPRFRLLSRGFATLGIKSEKFLNHYSPRIVYIIELAKNSKEFLNNYSDELHYYFDSSSKESEEKMTNKLIDTWKERWLNQRINNTEVDIRKRLMGFMPEKIILSNLF